MTANLSLRSYPMAVIGTLGCILFFAHVTGLRNLLAGLATLLVLAVVIKKRHLPEAFRPVILWMAVGLVSASWSVAPGQSFGDALTSVLLPVGCGLAAYIWMKREHVESLVVYPVLLGLILVLLIRVAHSGFSAPSPWLEKLYAYWPGRGVMSTLCILILPLGAWLLATGRRTLGIALVGLALLAGSQNWNRMFWFAALAILLPCLFMARIGQRTRMALLVLGVLCAGSGVLYSQSQIGELSAVDAAKSDLRWQIWKAWLQVADERPWLGYGYGIRAMNLVGREKELPEVLGQGIGHPHNIFLGQLVQTGAIGLLLFLAALGSLAWRFARQIRKQENRAAAIGGVALIVGFLVKNMTDDFFNYSVATLFWIQLAVFLRLAGVGDDTA